MNCLSSSIIGRSKSGTRTSCNAHTFPLIQNMTSSACAQDVSKDAIPDILLMMIGIDRPISCLFYALWGNKTFRPQDVSPLVVSPLVISPPFWSPSRFRPPTLVVSPPNHFPLFFFFFFFYIKDLLTSCETERKGEREQSMYFE